MAKKKLEPEVELRLNKEYEAELIKLEKELEEFFKADPDTRWEKYSKKSMMED